MWPCIACKQVNTVTTGRYEEPSGGADTNKPAGLATRQRSISIDVDTQEKVPPVMSIVASMKDEGLGKMEWWEGEDEQPNYTVIEHKQQT